jgi:hypothetical protein
LVKLGIQLQKAGDYFRAARVFADAAHFMYPTTKATEASAPVAEQDNVIFYLPKKEPLPVDDVQVVKGEDSAV